MPLSPLSGAHDPWARPNPARMYDYFLGGSHNTALDRQVAEHVLAISPAIRQAAWANRAFLRRVVHWMLADGIVQFLDIGAGLPTLGSVHELIQAANPAARVVYVDSDPVTVLHSQTILHGNPNATALHADARQINAILDHEAVTCLLDRQRPVGVLLVAVLHFIADDAEVVQIVQTCQQRLAPGSCIAIAHVIDDSAAREQLAQVRTRYGDAAHGELVAPRTRTAITRLFTGWDLVAPGVVSMPLWHPESPDDPLYDQPERSLLFAGVGRKPGQSDSTRGATRVQRPTPQAGRLAAAVETPAGGSILDHLRARRDVIAQQWYAAIRGSGYALRSLPQVATALGALTDRVIA
ncbi:MAG: SAM-dependent methyltransferase, partial [Chloroflexales bacterium]|nr:SAM-dependent methyltransferase [Chloroflexales bacterium]